MPVVPPGRCQQCLFANSVPTCFCIGWSQALWACCWSQLLHLEAHPLSDLQVPSQSPRRLLCPQSGLIEPWTTRGVSLLSPSEGLPVPFSSAPFDPAAIGHYVSQSFKNLRRGRPVFALLSALSSLFPMSLTSPPSPGTQRWEETGQATLMFSNLLASSMTLCSPSPAWSLTSSLVYGFRMMKNRFCQLFLWICPCFRARQYKSRIWGVCWADDSKESAINEHHGAAAIVVITATSTMLHTSTWSKLSLFC